VQMLQLTSLRVTTSSLRVRSWPCTPEVQRCIGFCVSCSSSGASGREAGDHSRQVSNNGGAGQGFGKAAKSLSRKLHVSNSADALLRSVGEVSSSTGREAQTRNLVLGTDNSVENWRQLDEKVNEYPGPRSFKAIGSGGEDFVNNIRSAVEEVVGKLKGSQVQQRPSSGGKYVSVTLKCWVEDPDQVVAIYAAMRQDSRLRWYL